MNYTIDLRYSVEAASLKEAETMFIDQLSSMDWSQLKLTPRQLRDFEVQLPPMKPKDSA